MIGNEENQDSILHFASSGQEVPRQLGQPRRRLRQRRLRHGPPCSLQHARRRLRDPSLWIPAQEGARVLQQGIEQPSKAFPGHPRRCKGCRQDPVDQKHVGQGRRADRLWRHGIYFPQGE